MTTNYRVTDGNFRGSDLDDILMRREYFTNNELWIWGRENGFGMLGNGTNTGNRSSPVTIAGNSYWWRSVARFPYGGGAIKLDGSLWCWGFNTSGQVGDGSTTNRSSPVTVAGGGLNWKFVAGGGTPDAVRYHSAGIKADGTLWTWGNNAQGQLGDGSTTNRSSPATTAGGGNNWRYVAATGENTAAIKTDGTLWTWGRNQYGELASGNTTARSSPVTVAVGGTDWKQVCAGEYYFAALKTTGEIYLWGRNNLGQLGDGSTTNRSSPVTVAGGGTNWKTIWAGKTHAAGIKTDGTIWCWGDNSTGQLGDGSTTNRSSPVSVVGGFRDWVTVGGGSAAVVAVRANDQAWAWGNNAEADLGDGSTTNRSSPVSVVGGLSWNKIATGWSHGAMAALKK